MMTDEKNKEKINIIGAGPVGCYTAYLLSKKGYDVNIFEEDKKVGSPVQCTGIVTAAIKDIIKPRKEFVLNEIEKIGVFSPDNSSIELELKDKEIVLDRARFDEHLCNKAADSGAKVFLEHRLVDYRKESIFVKDLEKGKIKEIKKDVLIGADGPLSMVAKKAGLFSNRKFLVGIQARIRMKNDASVYRTFFGRKFPGFFGWVVPESESIARVGLAAENNVKSYFDSFIKRFDGNVIEKQGGLIPIYNSKVKTQLNSIYLVGDAACQIKNTTGGGIVPGLICGEALADSIINRKDYEREWRRRIGRELFIHSKIRDMLNKFSDKDYNFLINLMGNEKIKKILEEDSRDFPSRFMLKLLIKEPRFLYFLGKAL